MPFPHDADGRTSPMMDTSSASEIVLGRKLVDKERIEDAEGSILDVPMDDVSLPGEGGATGRSDGKAVCSDRAELIERLKRGESPQWIPNQSVSSSITAPTCVTRCLCYLCYNLAHEMITDRNGDCVLWMACLHPPRCHSTISIEICNH